MLSVNLDLQWTTVATFRCTAKSDHDLFTGVLILFNYIYFLMIINEKLDAIHVISNQSAKAAALDADL